MIWGNQVRLPLTLEPQPEGGFTITSPASPRASHRSGYSSRCDAQRLGCLASGLGDIRRRGPSSADGPSCDGRVQWTTYARYPYSRVRYRELARILLDLGCQEVPRRSRGSHRRWRNDANGRTASIPDWGSKDLRTGTVRAVIRQLGLPYPLPD